MNKPDRNNIPCLVSSLYKRQLLIRTRFIRVEVCGLSALLRLNPTSGNNVRSFAIEPRRYIATATPEYHGVKLRTEGILPPLHIYCMRLRRIFRKSVPGHECVSYALRAGRTGEF